jgi:hypothetical protein
MWENFKSNKGPRPPPYKEFTNQPKTTYNLTKAVSKMIDSLPYEKSYYHLIMDKEFDYEAMFEMLNEKGMIKFFHLTNF